MHQPWLFSHFSTKELIAFFYILSLCCSYSFFHELFCFVITCTFSFLRISFTFISTYLQLHVSVFLLSPKCISAEVLFVIFRHFVFICQSSEQHVLHLHDNQANMKTCVDASSTAVRWSTLDGVIIRNRNVWERFCSHVTVGVHNVDMDKGCSAWRK